MQEDWHINHSKCAVPLRSVIVAAIFSVSAAIAPVHVVRAEMTVKQYRDMSSKSGAREAVLLYLAGLINGVVWVETEYGGVDDKAPKVKPIFCLPKAAILDDIRLAIDEELVRRAEYWNARPEATVGQVAVETFRRIYPCA